MILKRISHKKKGLHRLSVKKERNKIMDCYFLSKKLKEKGRINNSDK